MSFAPGLTSRVTGRLGDAEFAGVKRFFADDGVKAHHAVISAHGERSASSLTQELINERRR